MKRHRNVVVFIACSLDGYIAKPGDDLSFLDMVSKEGEDYGYTEFKKSVDTVILGRKTYDWVQKNVEVFPHKDVETYVITRTPRETADGVVFYTGDIQDLISRLKEAEGKNIFIDGGSEVVNLLLSHKLVDELVISVIPVLLGLGIPLFREGIPEQRLILEDVRTYPTGLVQLKYGRI